jgi:hypothetical protein
MSSSVKILPTIVSEQSIDTDTKSNAINDKSFYINNSVVNKMIHENDIGDLKRSLSIRYYMYTISIITNLTGSLSLSANIITNIVQSMIDSKEKLLTYQIISIPL